MYVVVFLPWLETTFPRLVTHLAHHFGEVQGQLPLASCSQGRQGGAEAIDVLENVDHRQPLGEMVVVLLGKCVLAFLLVKTVFSKHPGNI